MKESNMKKHLLNPSEILLAGDDELRDVHLLGVYFYVAMRGKPRSLPPIVVTRLEDVDKYGNWFMDHKKGFMQHAHEGERERDTALARLRDSQELMRRVREVPYLIQDGNHRAVASALAGNQVYAVELDRDSDFASVRRMLRNGELVGFPHDEIKSVEMLNKKWLAYALETEVDERFGTLNVACGLNRRVRDLPSLEGRVRQLAIAGAVPNHMCEHYLKWSGTGGAK